VHLALTVYDVSLTYDDVTDCQPFTWRNGQTYSESNTGSTAIDTVVLHNQYECDSVVQLRFTLIPVTARIKSSLEHFDFDHLDVVLTDVSTGNDSRRWKFPTSPDQTGAKGYYSIPVNLDEAHIWLLAYSPYGCVDSTDIIIPFNKENFWVPNAFTPDDPAGNNIFSSISTKTISQEMYIYNRLGELVFQCEGADCGWDGKNMNGTPCPQGAYVYVIRYTNGYEPKVIKVKRGTVTLIR
jgi:gliding motility-associated-like protein